jgi:hypothetical protein
LAVANRESSDIDEPDASRNRHAISRQRLSESAYRRSGGFASDGDNFRQRPQPSISSMKKPLIAAALVVALAVAITTDASALTRRPTDYCAGIGPYYWEIGDVNGPITSGSVNSTSSEHYDAVTPIEIASASKWLYGAYVTQVRVPTADDKKFLHMTGGYDDFGMCLAFQTVASCANAGSNGTFTPSADGKFYYSGAQMQHLGSITEVANYRDDALGAMVSSALGVNVTYQHPQLAGGVVIAPKDYAEFLRRIMGGQLAIAKLLGAHPVCTNPATCSTALNSPVPESWHYSYGHWVEDDPTTGDGTFSSPGAFGFYPWISADRRYYGIVARHSGEGAWSSVQCGRQIRASWIAQHAQ